MEFGDLLTQAGITTLALLVVGVIKTTLPSFDSARFGAITSIGIGIVAAVAANAAAVAGVNQLSVPEAVFLGLLGGAAASGLYDAGRGATNT